MLAKKLYIGVDPDVNKSGFAFLYRKTWSLHTIELFDFIRVIEEQMSLHFLILKEDVYPFVESPLCDSNNFGSEGLFKAKRIQFRNQRFPNFEDKALRLSLQVAVRKGRCAQIAEEIIKAMIAFGIPESNIQRIAPSQRCRFDKFPLNKVSGSSLKSLARTGNKYPSKMDHKRFRKLTGISDKTTNPEKRDAGLLLIQQYLNTK